MNLFRPASSNKYIIVSASVLLLGLGLSLLGSKFLFEYTHQQHKLWIERNAEARSEQLQISISTAINKLSSISPFFKVHENINQDQFSMFVQSDAAIKTGILALAWAPRITHDQRKQFEIDQDINLRGYRSITEINGHGLIIPAQIRDEYFPIQNLFTNQDTGLYVGLNLTAQPVMRQYIDEAIESGDLFSTEAKRSSLATPDKKRFQAYFPVYNSDDLSEKNHLLGFAMGMFDVETLLNNTFRDADSVNFLLFDVNSKKKNQLISKSKTEYLDKMDIINIHDLSKLTIPYWTRYFEVGNRTWLGVFLAEENNEAVNNSWLPYFGLFLGLLITTILSIYLFIALIRGRQIHNLEYQLDGSEQLLTSQRTALNEQSQLSRKFEHESVEKTRFLHALGHDLRQPLSTLGLYLAQLKFEEENNNKQILDKTKLTLKSLNHMFESMLEMARLEAGTIQTDIMNIDLRILFQSLQEEFELHLDKKNLKLHIRCNEHMVYSDPVLLEGILRNLLINAIKFTEKGKILLASRSHRKRTIIYIMDTGQGIDDEKRDEIFRPYTRGDAVTDDIGLGLGLAIVMHAVELLGHKLEVNSKLGHGTCFKLVIDKYPI
jgi:signal transduction histidine kinase/CHASE1-domain containing sensor protein